MTNARTALIGFRTTHPDPFGLSLPTKHFVKTDLLALGLLLAFDLLFSSPLVQQTKIDSGYAEVNGTKLYYELSGSGDPVVLIHGSFGDRRHWDLQVKELASKYKVIRYDVRGYGKSALPNADEAYTDAEDLKALLDLLKIDKAHFCGLSMGSIIAIDFALAYPERCSSLILAGPRVAGDGAAEYRTADTDSVSACISKAVSLVREKGAKEGTDFLWTGNNPMSKSVRSTKTSSALLQMGYEYSWWRYLNTSKRGQLFPMAIKQLSEIRKPTLIVTAEYDLELCKNVAKILEAGIPGAKLISIQGGGHIMNMDKSGEFNNAVSTFIGQVK